MIQHQYWVTKKCVLRKLGGKEDECIVSSDAELDAKLELFRSVAESCVHLQRVIDLYQERLCCLAQEENELGRYLKEAGKNEKNSNAGQIMVAAGKALAYTGHQRLTMRSPLVRLHHEVETFRGRAVSDTRVTIMEMEKSRTEYRAALSWMKSASAQLDPDTGLGLEKFRKAQSHVRSSKARFDQLMLACLQKVDLLAAARCNMFSHALVGYQNSIATFSSKASDTLSAAAVKLNKVQPYDFFAVSELATSVENLDTDKKTFFNAEYTDKEPEKSTKKQSPAKSAVTTEDNETTPKSENDSLLLEDIPILDLNEEQSQEGSLLDLTWPSSSTVLSEQEFLPSQLIQAGQFNLSPTPSNEVTSNQVVKSIKKPETPTISKAGAQLSWLSLFDDLDPLSKAAGSDKSSNDQA